MPGAPVRADCTRFNTEIVRFKPSLARFKASHVPQDGSNLLSDALNLSRDALNLTRSVLNRIRNGLNLTSDALNLARNALNLTMSTLNLSRDALNLSRDALNLSRNGLKFTIFDLKLVLNVSKSASEPAHSCVFRSASRHEKRKQRGIERQKNPATPHFRQEKRTGDANRSPRRADFRHRFAAKRAFCFVATAFFRRFCCNNFSRPVS